MNLFDDNIEDLRSFLDNKKTAGTLRELKAVNKTWPDGERGNLVLASDTAIELGCPEKESVSFMVWTEKSDLIKNGCINLIGPDISESRGNSTGSFKRGIFSHIGNAHVTHIQHGSEIIIDRMQSLPFGKVVLLKLKGMDENNCYERHRQIDMARYDLNLKGYMMRAASQYMREWSRVGKEAIERGFGFVHLAGALSAIYNRLEFVEGIEFIFITSSTEDVRSLAPTGSTVEKRISAMNKMATELSFDCGSCDYTEICTEVEGLRNMRRDK